MSWKKYKRRTITEIRPFIVGEDDALFDGKQGDMVARDAAKPEDQWLLTEEFFKANYDLLPE